MRAMSRIGPADRQGRSATRLRRFQTQSWYTRKMSTSTQSPRCRRLRAGQHQMWSCETNADRRDGPTKLGPTELSARHSSAAWPMHCLRSSDGGEPTRAEQTTGHRRHHPHQPDSHARVSRTIRSAGTVPVLESSAIDAGAARPPQPLAARAVFASHRDARARGLIGEAPSRAITGLGWRCALMILDTRCPAPFPQPPVRRPLPCARGRRVGVSP